MSILINEKTRILIQGITGRSGSLQAEIMLNDDVNIVAGVTPGKGGMQVHGIPVFDYIREAKEHVDFDVIVSFVPPAAFKSGCVEAVDSGIKLLVSTTEGIARHDALYVIQYSRAHGCTLLGPGCAGVIAPGKSKAGVHPSQFFLPGRVGVISKSGALSYEIGKTLSEAGIGQSAVVAIGGGPHWGFTQADAIRHFSADPDTHVIVLLGEIGGNLEELAAEAIANDCEKPVVTLIVGRFAPKGKSLGHAGAITSGDFGTASGKIKALQSAGARIVKSPSELVLAVKDLINNKG